MLSVVVVVYVVAAITFSELMPFNKGPDESINLDYVEFIAQQNRLPISYDERAEVGPKSNWPPLYHLLVARISNIFDIDWQSPQIKIFWDTFRYRALDVQAKSVWFITTEDYLWPYVGPILVLHIGRWLSIVFGAATLWLVYLTCLEIWPNQTRLALIATALLAFIPTFIFVSASFNEDALVALLATLYFWLLLRLIKRPQTIWLYGLMGLVLGVSVTAKYTTVVLPVEVLLVIAVLARQAKQSWRWWLMRVMIVGLGAVLASSWWFGWNFWFLNQVRELGLVSGLLHPLLTGGYDVTMSRLGNFLSGGEIGLSDLPEGTQIGTFSRWLQVTFLSFWGVSFGGQLPGWPYMYIFIGFVLVAAGVGLWRLWQTQLAVRNRLILLASHIGLFVIAPLVRFWLSRRIGQTAQGRHILFPAAVAIVALLVWGLTTILPRRWQMPVLAGLIIVFMAWTSLHLGELSAFAPSPLPLRTVEQAATWLSQPIDAQFGDGLELVSFDLIPNPPQGLLRLNLAWHSLAYVNESYLLKVELVNEVGKVVSHWLGYNGGGRVPTLAWTPGDSVFDRLALPLPNLPAGIYRAQVQLLNSDGGAVPLKKGGEGAVLPLGEVTLTSPTHLFLRRNLHLAETDIPFDLWQAGGPVVTETPTYRYPATIGVIVSSPGDVSALKVELVDPTGQVRPATVSQANIYTFVIGARWASGQYRLRLTWSNGDQITSDPLLSVENWWSRRFAAPQIDTPLTANFANQLQLLGYKLPQNRVKAGESFPITFYWRALTDKSPQADFTQFNHLLDPVGNLRGGYDRRPLEYYSTLLWAPGEVVIDGYAVPVDADAPPGEYYLDVGYYLTVGESAVNLPLVVDGQVTDGSSVSIGPIEVAE